jgi:hypothetical protein
MGLYLSRTNFVTNNLMYVLLTPFASTLLSAIVVAQRRRRREREKKAEFAATCKM